MKKQFVLIAVMLFIVSCTGFDEANNEGSIKELSLGVTSSGSISDVGKVDWYHYRVVDANNLLQVSCSNNTYRSDLELLVTVYEEDENGNRTRLSGTHAPEGSQLPANLLMNVYIDRPKDLFFAVRDLMDDAASDHPYYLKIDFAQRADGNDNFTQAVSITVDDPATCVTDVIGHIGDIDCFQFVADQSGVYAIDIDFHPFGQGTPVALAMTLYDNDGVMITSLQKPQSRSYKMLPYLTTGAYYVIIHDFGRDDFDPASTYQICVSSMDSDETRANDEMDSASEMNYEAVSRTYSAEGALDYLEDRDWYRMPLDEVSTVGFKVLEITFDDVEGLIDFGFQMELYDGNDTPLLMHRFNAGSSAYRTQIKAGAGDHYLVIRAADGSAITKACPYALSVAVLDIDDPAENTEKIDSVSGETVYGNNTITTADGLIPSADPNGFTTGKIGFRGDEDWYAVTIDNATVPHILEVYLDTDGQPSLVEYYVSIMRDQVITKMFDANGSDGGTELKTSIFIPASASPVLTYYLRVCDYQGDDGDGNVPYRIRTNVMDVPADLPADSQVLPAARIYYDEISERAASSAETILVELNSLVQKSYKANTTLLKFNGSDTAAGVTKTANPDGTTTITFPWIAGYIDFQGDQDWFKMNLEPLMQAGLPLDTQWYYDVKVDLHVDAPGSAVEYVWKLYRDYNSNGILVDRPLDSDGFFASAGDTTTSIAPLDISVPESGSGDTFWVGDAWAGNFYFNMSDFNFIAATQPDDDWGYDGAPYYFKITLVYHPGVSHP